MNNFRAEVIASWYSTLEKHLQRSFLAWCWVLELLLDTHFFLGLSSNSRLLSHRLWFEI
jgi:hypothetical protein